MSETEKLKFADVKKVVGEHLKTALDVENFSITFAKQEGNDWRVNIEYPEKIGTLTWRTNALFTIDATTGEVKVFEKGRYWTF